MQVHTLLTPQTCMRTDLESDLRLGYAHLNRPSSTNLCPLKTARARRTPDHTPICATWWRSCSVEFLWSWLLSSGFRCGLLWSGSRDAWIVGMATKQMAQMLAQLQRLSQQLVNQQQMFQQSLEMQRQQSQAQMETLTSLGAAQVAKTTYDARDFSDESVFQDERFQG